MRKRNVLLSWLLAVTVSAAAITPAMAADIPAESLADAEQMQDTDIVDSAEEPSGEDTAAGFADAAEEPDETENISEELQEEIPAVSEEPQEVPVISEAPTESAEDGVPEEEPEVPEEKADVEIFTDALTILTEIDPESETGENTSFAVRNEYDEAGNLISVWLEWPAETGKCYRYDVAGRKWHCMSAQDKTQEIGFGESGRYVLGESETFGSLTWNLAAASDGASGISGYYWNSDSQAYEYYLAEADVQELEGALPDVPLQIYIGAKGNIAGHNGLQEIDGQTYYLNEDGSLFKNGSQSIDGKTYCFDENGVCTKSYTPVTPGWVQEADGKYYWRQEDGTYFTEGGLQTLDGKKYYLDPETGARVSGWVDLNGYRYYFRKLNGVRATGMLKISGSYYYFGPKGKRLTGWRTVNGKRYYFRKDANGKRASDWLTINGKQYYFNPTTGVVTTGAKKLDNKIYVFGPKGMRRTKGWVTCGNYKYYVDPATGYGVTGWKTINGKRYYFIKSKNGRRATGWLTISGKRYYFNPKTAVLKTGVLSLDGKLYYLDSTGAQVKSGWVTSGTSVYYVDPATGCMVTGWQTIDGKKYYFLKGTGKRAGGWLTISSKTYYFTPSTGEMMTGLLSLNGNKYYLNAKGVRATGWRTVDGAKYYFSKVIADARAVTGLAKIGKKYYYFLSDGTLVTNKSFYIIGTKYYSIDEKGVATELEDSEAQILAKARLNQIGWNLRSAFNWSAGLDYVDNDNNPPAGYTFAEYNAVYGFKYLRGDCQVMAATFYYMAQALGYDVHMVRGYVPLLRGGMGPHAWCEIVIDGKTYIFDPNFTNETGRNGYQITYGTSGTWQYSSYYRIN